MTITYPLSLPTTKTARRVRMGVRPGVGAASSNFSLGMQTYAWPVEIWTMQFDLPQMERADAEEWVAFLLSLNGMEGSFLAGQPGYSSPRGSWSGQSPIVNNETGSPTASQTGRVLNIKSLTPFTGGKKGDYFQLGSASSSRLYKLLSDFTADSSGWAAVDIAPRIRVSPAHGDAVTLSNPKGLWMLDSNQGEWDIEEAMIYGLSFSAKEDVRGL